MSKDRKSSIKRRPRRFIKNKDKNPSIKLRAISINNYKGIDSLLVEFPAPMLPKDPDILIMGSENGLGKTSVIECCALILMCLSTKENTFSLSDRYLSIDVPDLLIRAGSKVAEITGHVVIDKIQIYINMQIERSGEVRIDKRSGKISMDKRSGKISIDKSKDSERLESFYDDDIDVDEFIKEICGFSPNPVIENSFLLFHSYRKVQEGNPELGMMVSYSRIIRSRHRYRRYRHMEMPLPLSNFKIIILRSLMNKAELFELAEEKEPEKIIDKLNELVEFYAGGKIGQLRPSAENTVDFRIKPVGDGESLTYDGLSSGQKEIISTLFLIWYHTNNNPSVVFIDEPELHLNAQWHRSFVKKLIELVPKNQYVLATHSEDIMDSVPDNRRILLLNEEESGND